MGYPMSWRRLVGRNRLGGDYTDTTDPHSTIRGDMRRLEQDARDEAHLQRYADAAGITTDQAKTVLDCFFDGFPADAPERPQVGPSALGSLEVVYRYRHYNIGVVEQYSHCEGWYQREGAGELTLTRCLDDDVHAAAWRAIRTVIRAVDEEAAST